MAKKDDKAKIKNEKKHYFKEFKAELKKVNWLTPKELVNSTLVVLTMVLVIAAIVFVLDVVFDSMNKYGVTPMQSVVNEKFNVVENETTNTELNNTTDNTSTEVTNSQESVNNTVDNNTINAQ